MDYKEIKLTKGKVAIVDEEDYEWISQWNWHFHTSHYAVSGGNYYSKDRKIPKRYMHRIIMAAPEGMQVDHINGNGLDNRKKNLRVCTQSQNKMNAGKSSANTSGYKGVAWHKASGKWQAYVNTKEKFHSLGYFTDKKTAARAYNQKATELFGEYARLNEV